MQTIREYEVKVTYQGDDVIVFHAADDGSITVPYDSEQYTATDAVRALMRDLYDIEIQFDVSADLPGGKLYIVSEAPAED